jgi:hypothetical protein
MNDGTTKEEVVEKVDDAWFIHEKWRVFSYQALIFFNFS